MPGLRKFKGYVCWALVCNDVKSKYSNKTTYWGTMLGLMADSRTAYAKEYFPELLLPESLSSRWATAIPSSAGDPRTLAAVWLTGSWCSGQVSGLRLGGGRAELRTLAHIISISQSSPRDVHLNAKTQLHSMTSKLQCWTPHAKQRARQEHNPTH